MWRRNSMPCLPQLLQEYRDRKKARQQKQIWREIGLIGCIKDGPEELSTSYKRYVAEYLDQKYAQHDQEK